MAIEIRKLEKRDDRSLFHSGDIEIDRFFIQFAGQNQFKHRIGTTYVAVDHDRQSIVGYATVSIGSLTIDGLDIKEFEKFPNYPLPILRVARLGVDKAYQSQGIGAKLLQKMLHVAMDIEAIAGCSGIFVDAKEDAIEFYQKYAFEIAPTLSGVLPTRPKQTLMYLSMKTIYKILK